MKLICRCEKCKRKLKTDHVMLTCPHCGGDVYMLKAVKS